MKSELLKPTKLKEIADKYGLSPSKKYGQNYLLNEGVIQKMVDSAQVSSEDTIVEIGPGFGTLTFALAQKAKKVISYEIEKKLIPYWKEQGSKQENIEIIWGNAIQEIEKKGLPKQYKVVANLPYQITSRILRLFLDARDKPKTMVIMVQKEVADRIIAKPGDMSILSVSIQYYGKPKIITKVSKGNFWPSPKVDSAVIAITDIKQQIDSEFFFKIVREGFSNKRKQLWRNLHDGLGLDKEKIQSSLKSILGNEKIRAQELSIENWRELVNNLEF